MCVHSNVFLAVCWRLSGVLLCEGTAPCWSKGEERAKELDAVAGLCGACKGRRRTWESAVGASSSAAAAVAAVVAVVAAASTPSSVDGGWSCRWTEEGGNGFDEERWRTREERRSERETGRGKHSTGEARVPQARREDEEERALRMGSSTKKDPGRFYRRAVSTDARRNATVRQNECKRR